MTMRERKSSLPFSTTTGYALQALVCLAEPACCSGLIGTIATCTGIPPAYLKKVFRRLSTGGLVITKRGAQGGVRLARPPASIRLLDVLMVMEPGAFPLQMTAAPRDANRLICFIAQQQSAWREAMRAITLADLLPKQSRRTAA